jgi:hypothetical protein
LRTDSDNIKVPIAALRRAFSLFEAIYKLFWSKLHFSCSI